MTHVTYHYESTPSAEWTMKAYALQLRGEIRAVLLDDGNSVRMVASGRCPRCDGHFSVDRSSQVVVVTRGALGSDQAAVGDQSGAPSFVPEVVVCNATGVPGRPRGATGCGACFSLHAEVQHLPKHG